MSTHPAATWLPQQHGRPMVTDGGLETDLIFNRGVDLPQFAAFPLLEDEAGRALLVDYYDGYAVIAERAGAGLMLESATWRASPDWGALLGYGADDLAGLNAEAVAHLAGLRDRYRDRIDDIVLSGTVGPRGDGYRPGRGVDPDEAGDYHAGQVRAFADAGADLVTAYTLTDPGEAVGVVRAVREVGLPVAISFTVEVDGVLPGGATLRDAIAEVDAQAPPDYYLVNCAHPEHVEPALTGGGAWADRVLGMRYNSSTRSHAELDDAPDLDLGDLDVLALGHARVNLMRPGLRIVGGCCGTDARHVARLWSNG